MRDKPHFLFIDKPKGMTSRKSMESIFHTLNLEKKTKRGLEGILDPFATGLVIVGIGKATKYLAYFHDLIKEYKAVISLGTATDSMDCTGDVIEVKPVPTLNCKDVVQISSQFIGDIWQTPPLYSNIKVNGKRAHRMARAGMSFTLPKRKVHIENIDIVQVAHQEIHFHCRVSSGTYIRSLAYDMAIQLNTVGHLKELRRSKIGFFSLDNHPTPKLHTDPISYTSSDIYTSLYWLPEIILDSESVINLHHGRKLHSSVKDGLYKVICKTKFCGLVRIAQGSMHSVRIFSGE